MGVCTTFPPTEVTLSFGNLSPNRISMDASYHFALQCISKVSKFDAQINTLQLGFTLYNHVILALFFLKHLYMNLNEATLTICT